VFKRPGRVVVIRMVKSIVIKIKMVYVVVGNSTETLVTAKEMRFLLINCLSEGRNGGGRGEG